MATEGEPVLLPAPLTPELGELEDAPFSDTVGLLEPASPSVRGRDDGPRLDHGHGGYRRASVVIVGAEGRLVGLGIERDVVMGGAGQGRGRQ